MGSQFMLLVEQTLDEHRWRKTLLCLKKVFETFAISRSYKFNCLLILFFCSSLWWAHDCSGEHLSVGVLYECLPSSFLPRREEVRTPDSFSGRILFHEEKVGGFLSFSLLIRYR